MKAKAKGTPAKFAATLIDRKFILNFFWQIRHSIGYKNRQYQPNNTRKE
jgi:hypothetical protein